MNRCLFLAAAGNALVALAHAACLMVGAPLYRLMGAPPDFIALVERGHPYPFLLTATIAAVFLLAARYAWAATRAQSLPVMRPFLLIITIAYALRALLFPWLKPFFPGNSDAFWYTTSAFCLMLALCHGAGLWQMQHNGGRP